MTRTKLLPLMTGAAILAGATLPALAADYTIGVSNTVQGNGWREEMICAIKAQALASGKVASLNIAHRNTDAAGQLEDLRNLIAAGVDAIVVNPSDPAGIGAALKEATDAGIVVVAVDQTVNEPTAYIVSNNQEEYAYLGAKWLFEQIGGKGDVVYMRGAAGASADSDRDKGFKRALAEFPDVKVVHEVFTGWQQDQGKQQILDYIATGAPFDGIWTSGIDNVIVDALVESQVDLVPVVGADNAGFVGQLNSVEGLTGAAVTNPGSIGGAGVTLAIQILDGQKPAEQTVLVKPELWENATEEGKAKLAAAADPALDPEWPVSISIPDWTTYTKEQIIACKGPGE
jgi:ribose transport system substrate-binding protein